MYAAIMAGGEGTRLWPASRDTCPKQFINVLGGEPLVVQTLDRLEGLLPLENILVLINHKHQEAARRLLPDLPPENLIVEPRIRDTGPCIGLACEIIRKRAGEETVVCLPSDHLIDPPEALRECLRRAEACVRAEPGALYAIGIRPMYPATGYGYLLRGRALGEVDGEPVFDVISFHEKPSIALAEAYLDAGDYFWNSGICFGRTDTLREEIRRHQPELAEGLRQLAPALDTDGQAAALAKIYPRFQRINVSDGVMEKADQVRVIEGHFAWDDVGTWRILQAHLTSDEHGNVAQGESARVDVEGNIIFAGRDQLVAALGVRDLVIVATPDATLVTTRDRVEDVRKIVADLKARHKDRYL